MKNSKIILVLLMMFFCVGVLAPPASALMRDPDQPRVDERLPEGDEGGWGGTEQTSISTGGVIKSSTIVSSPYLPFLNIFFNIEIIKQRYNNFRVYEVNWQQINYVENNKTSRKFSPTK